jgi:succinate dehydrogenase / fumarate reductase flavoprotein subunit
VHGANRLGTNSLLDLLVFGKSAGETVVERPQGNVKAHSSRCRTDSIERTLARLNRLNTQTDGADVHETRLAMQRTMQKHCRRVPLQGHAGRRVWRRFSKSPKAGGADRDQGQVAGLQHGRIEALELDNLIEVAKATMISAEARKESRGAHVRDDAPDTAANPNGRDDKNWLKHTLWYREGNRLDYKPVHMKPLSVDTIALKKRAY